MTKAKKQATVSTSTIISDICKKISEIPKKLTKEVIMNFLELVEENVAKGFKVRIDKVGILQSKDRAARKGRNPQTGEEIKIPASKKVAFRVASSLKEKAGAKKKIPAKKKK